MLEGRRASRKLTRRSRRMCERAGRTAARGNQVGFQRELSQETLRPLLAELKGNPRSPSGTGPAEPTTTEDLPQSSQNAPEDQALSSERREKPCDCAGSAVAPEPEPPTVALESAPQTVWCDHVGVLVLAPILVAVAQVVDPAEPLFKQWLASLLLDEAATRRNERTRLP